MIIFRIKHPFCIKNCIHPSLIKRLQIRGMLPLKSFQIQAFKAFGQGKNIFVNSCTGSGKTFSYLLPIINTMYQQKSQRKKALILTLNKQLVSQVYLQSKMLDCQNKLNILRTGTLTQLKSLPDKNEELSQQYQGLTDRISWHKTDILISTPQNLMNYLTIFKSTNSQMSPSVVVVDQADLLLEIDRNVSKTTDKIMMKINDQLQVKPQYLFTASSFPKKYKKQQSIYQLQKLFKPLRYIQGQSMHKLPEKLDLYYIDMQQKDDQALQQEKKHYLRKVLEEKRDKRIIIFCKFKKDILMLQNFIAEHFAIQTNIFYAELRAQQRMQSISSFSSGMSRILICSELGSRGLDFNLPVDCVVQYDMADNIVHFINRAGRTARNNLHGDVITFVEHKNRQFFRHLQALQSQNQHFDSLFSRKRSYSKLYGKRQQQL